MEIGQVIFQTKFDFGDIITVLASAPGTRRLLAAPGALEGPEGPRNWAAAGGRGHVPGRPPGVAVR